MRIKLSLIFLSFFAIIAFVPKAHCADLVGTHPYNKAENSLWPGFYFGLETSKHRSYLIEPKNPDMPVDLNDLLGKSPLYGVFAGYNLALTNNLILGLSGNIDFSTLKDLLDYAIDNITIKMWTEEKYFVDLDAHLGYAIGRFLPYIKAGISVASLKNVAAIGYTDLVEQVKPGFRRKTGAEIGMGFDYAIDQNLFLRCEYFYQYFRRPIFIYYEMQDKDSKPRYVNTEHRTIKTKNFRIGIAYKF